MFFEFLNKKKGFTLVELMIVVLILGLLTAIGVPAYNGAKEYAERRIVEANLQLINNAIALYITTGGKYSNLTSVGDLVPKYLEKQISGPKKAVYSHKTVNNKKVAAVSSYNNEPIGGHVLNNNTYEQLPWTD